jgi:hypothetical protein
VARVRKLADSDRGKAPEDISRCSQILGYENFHRQRFGAPSFRWAASIVDALLLYEELAKDERSSFRRAATFGRRKCCALWEDGMKR